jgi:tRNA A58 N-methylase Trm61
MDRQVPERGGDLKVSAERVASQHDLREREKRDLRHERDRLVVDLAHSLGTDGLAQCFGTTAESAEKLVDRTRARLAGATAEISARRIAADPDRWREADRHYETLGRSFRLPASQSARD